MNTIIRNDVNKILESNLFDWDRFKGKTILITGANGMIPSYFVYTFIGLNDTITEHKDKVSIIALVRNKEKAERKFGSIMADKHFTLIVQDVSQPITYDGKIDYIVHAASQASPKYYGIDPVGTINANVLGSVNALNLAKEKNVSGYLYISSGDVYGLVDPEKFPFSEHDYGYIDLLNVRSCYGESKRMGEQYCVAYRHQYGVPAKIARVFHTYGPGMEMDDGRVFADFAHDIANGRNIVLTSDGKATRLFCYITDAIIAYLKIMLDGESGQAYNVANINCAVTISDLAHKLSSLYKEKNLEVIYLKNPDKQIPDLMKSPLKIALPDCSLIASLGWQPTVTIEEGFRNVIEFINAN